MGNKIDAPCRLNCCSFMHKPQLGSKLRMEILIVIKNYYRNEIRFNVSHTYSNFVFLVLILITSTSHKNLAWELT
jgi:hypothetical protein